MGHITPAGTTMSGYCVLSTSRSHQFTRLRRLRLLFPALVIVLIVSTAGGCGSPPRFQQPTLLYVGFSSSTPPGDRRACREAVAYAIDRQFIRERISESPMRPGVAYSIQHPLSEGSTRQQTKFRLDRVKAAKRFQECDWGKSFVALDAPMGSPSSFVFAYRRALIDSIR